jgi:hypothetical protein
VQYQREANTDRPALPLVVVIDCKRRHNSRVQGQMD